VYALWIPGLEPVGAGAARSPSPEVICEESALGLLVDGGVGAPEQGEQARVRVVQVEPDGSWIEGIDPGNRVPVPQLAIAGQALLSQGLQGGDDLSCGHRRARVEVSIGGQAEIPGRSLVID